MELTLEQKYIKSLDELSQLRDMYDILDKVFENSADAFWIFDSNGRCIRVNAAYEKLIGLSREELIGKTASELVGNVVSEVCTNRVLETKKSVTIEQEFFLTGKTALVTATPVFDNAGRLIIGICNDRDISTFQALREQLVIEKQKSSDYKTLIETLNRSQLYGEHEIIAIDPLSKHMLDMANKVAKTDATALILGETGVGKSEIAKYIHQNSNRRKEAFIEVSCGAFPPELIESELFGYEKGAFTGANKTGKMGLFEAANHGTIFLDEIGELSLHAQVTLLHVLQEQKVTRVGSTKQTSIDVRVVAATNRDLRDMVDHGLFREDLFYRINVFPINIPPLRMRPADLGPLSQLFLRQFGERYDCTKIFGPDAMEKITGYKWPGNIRELRNSIEQAFIRSESTTIKGDDFYFEDRSKENSNLSFSQIPGESLERFLERIEYSYMQEAYAKHGNVRDAAKALSMSPATFVRKRNKYQEIGRS